MKPIIFSLLMSFTYNLMAQDISEYTCIDRGVEAKPLSIQICYRKAGEVTLVSYIVKHDQYEKNPRLWEKALMFRIYLKPKCGKDFVSSPVFHTAGATTSELKEFLSGAVASTFQIIKPEQQLIIPMKNFFQVGFCKNENLTGMIIGLRGDKEIEKLKVVTQK